MPNGIYRESCSLTFAHAHITSFHKNGGPQALFFIGSEVVNKAGNPLYLRLNCEGTFRTFGQAIWVTLIARAVVRLFVLQVSRYYMRRTGAGVKCIGNRRECGKVGERQAVSIVLILARQGLDLLIRKTLNKGPGKRELWAARFVR